MRKTYGVKTLGVFGSFATGDQTENSDVDILVEFDHPIGLRFMELAEDLERLLARKADLLTWDGVKSIHNRRISHSIRESVIDVEKA